MGVEMIRDPLGFGPQARSANLSPLMQAQGRASLGEKVNFCPFGCHDDDVSDLGHCRHLAGYVNEGDQAKGFEPLGPPDAKGVRSVDGSKRVPLKKTDQLVRITVSYRVYRPDPGEGVVPEKKTA